MKKLLFVCLVFAAGAASAGWVKISENDETIVYIDLSTVRKDGNLRTVSQLHDEKKRSEDGVKSTRISWEYDCNNERVRIVAAASFPETMAGGKKLFSFYKTSEWRDIAPETAGFNGLKAVCAP
ncbi:MAG: hypothetical protein KA388_07660 [Rhodocyclaceae bacterium]|nr:hypothetical protein [Rhodocyclaceae bacterium]MBK9625226.1 hypothetical protein [Rhodocyclaceae bacterium]MBL0077491.1 hypothetical protein [Rhodocyclaceae bacterium]MBP6108876.1 hypothetical protein [Rhodocyclaceae bacterium]MBP6279619.1 hypothetical protein [Rhodocyclaceae bacterium]